MQYYGQKYSGLTDEANLLDIIFDKSFESDDQVSLGVSSFPLIKKNDNLEVVGFLYTSKNEKKDKRQLDSFDFIKIDDCAYVIDKEKKGKIVGYLPVDNTKAIAVCDVDTYKFIAVILLLMLALMMLFVGGEKSPGNDLPTPGDEINSGEITDTIDVSLDPLYFNVKINMTPVIEKNKMNIRIENSIRNKLDCYVIISVLNNGIKENIYKSAVIKPNQYLEYATIDTKLKAGNYKGEASYVILNENGNEVGSTAVELMINVR